VGAGQVCRTQSVIRVFGRALHVDGLRSAASRGRTRKLKLALWSPGFLECYVAVRVAEPLMLFVLSRPHSRIVIG